MHISWIPIFGSYYTVLVFKVMVITGHGLA